MNPNSLVVIFSVIGSGFYYFRKQITGHLFQQDRLYLKFLVGLIIILTSYKASHGAKLTLISWLLSYRNWIYETKSRKTKVWGIFLKLLVSKKNKLFHFQNSLPKYPLPSLDDTCERALVMAKPFLNEKEYELVVEALHELKEDKLQLQKILKARYKTEENWVCEWWDQYAYLAGRTPIPVHSNFGSVGDRTFKEMFKKCNQLSIAAELIHLAMVYKEKVDKELLTPMMVLDMVPICCDRYKNIFSTTRIPGAEMDELVHYPNSKHIVIFRKGFIYKMDVYAQVDGKETLLTPKEIQLLLKYIVDYSDRRPASADSPLLNPGVFTTANRTTWSSVRNRLQQDALNANSLQIVESAVFGLSLDDVRVQNLSEEFHNCLTGDAYNRWFDKSLVITVTADGSRSLNVEHATAEATISGRMWEYVICNTRFDADGNATHRNLKVHDNIQTPQSVEWNLAKFQEEAIKTKADYDQLKGDVDCLIYFLDKGKSFIKKLRLSPDGYIQMAMQLAFYRLHKETPKTYETATTRFFKLGRTETIRPVSEHSVNFTRSFDDSSVPRDVVVEHLKKAIRYQSLYKYDAMSGKAVDRHLFGLYVAGKLTGSVPKLFTLKPFYEADRLSTSQSPLQYDSDAYNLMQIEPVGGGFGAQRKDGYGISYFIDEHRVNFLISSYKSCPDTGSLKIAKAIEKAVNDIKSLLESVARPST